jgi:hypothetical protein
MSADRYERAYHLTRTGWVVGEFAFFGTVPQNSSAPPDRVLTIIEEAEQSCGFAPTEVSWREEWRSKSVDTRQITRLRKKFGEYPKRA